MNQIKAESNIRKVALTSLSGTSIEWYDFFLYGAAAGLVFPKLFFGDADPTTALILSFLISKIDILSKSSPTEISIRILFIKYNTMLS